MDGRMGVGVAGGDEGKDGEHEAFGGYAKMKMFMIDLETLGTNPGCVILSIGAVRFDSKKPGDWFYSRIDLQSSLDAGFRIESDTLMWWFRHGESAIEHSALGGEMILDALIRFRKFLGGGNLEIWGNGATFDNVILRGSFEKLGLNKYCWERRADRCYRTLCDTAGAGLMKDYDATFPLLNPPTWWGTVGRHHALRDAACQAAFAEKIFQRHGLPL